MPGSHKKGGAKRGRRPAHGTAGGPWQLLPPARRPLDQAGHAARPPPCRAGHQAQRRHRRQALSQV